MKQSREPSNLYLFGPFTLDAVERVLLRDGRVVRIPAKAFSTLLVLVRNSKHLVEKEVLMNEVWPEEFVEEGNLAQHISMLRKALGETETQKYIETIPRRGYRFLGLVRESSSQPPEMERRIIKRHTENSDAYQAYLKGRYHWSQYTTAGLEEAITWFGKAINLDPGFSLAYAAIIDCYLRLATNYLPPADNLHNETQEFGTPDCETRLPQAKGTLELRREWDCKSAERECQRASELKMNYPAAHQWYAAYEFARRLYERDEVNQQAAANALRNETSLDASVLENIQSSRPTPTEELQIFCLVAREQIEAGNYEAAYEVLQRWWTLGEWPRLDGLSPHSSADLLFTVGTLAGNVVSTRQVPRGQKHAETLLSGSIALFEQLNAKKRAAEGRIELGLCYQREGLFDLARAALLAALGDLSERDLELKSLVLMRLASLYRVAGRIHDALTWVNDAGAIVKSAGPWVTGRYLLEFASTLKDLAPIQENSDYFDQAIAHYTEALYEFRAVGQHRLGAIAENNYGCVLLTLNRLDEAGPHLIRARRCFDRFGDKVRSAQVDETTAQLHLAAKQFELAEKAIARSVETLERGGEDSLLAESLRTQGTVYWKLGDYRKAQSVLERAQQVAEHCGDVDGAERARLIKVEVIVQLSDELKRSEQRLHALEQDATKPTVVDDLANEMYQAMVDSKLVLDELLGVIGSGSLRQMTSDIEGKLIRSLETVSTATARGIKISQQMMKQPKTTHSPDNDQFLVHDGER